MWVCTGRVWMRECDGGALHLRRELRLPEPVPLCRSLRLREQAVGPAIETNRGGAGQGPRLPSSTEPGPEQIAAKSTLRLDLRCPPASTPEQHHGNHGHGGERQGDGDVDARRAKVERSRQDEGEWQFTQPKAS